MWCLVLFCFKQKTAYEMRISDWSSDVCSSDLCSTDDRYADDIHYRGGCLLNDNLAWSATVMAYSSRPPDPAIVGERWRGMWLERLENMPFLAANWRSEEHTTELQELMRITYAGF